MRSIGDAVITTDADGREDYANAIAEELNGWPLDEARGRPLVEVFGLLNEATREALEHPVLRCIREGQVIKPVEQAVLVTRKGQEIAIQDSAAPIRDRSGKVIAGVIFPFKIACIASTSVFASNGRRPQISSYSTMPSAKTSTRQSTASPIICSGAM